MGEPDIDRRMAGPRTGTSAAASKRPWWWLLAAPIYITAGLIRFLRHGSNA